jgi:hypothetical protein
MTLRDITRLRLRKQLLTSHPFARPVEVVKWLGAVQAQDYAAACWALGLRLESASFADIERAFAAGELLRTHVLRPTWHFVTPEDIRWLLMLTAPRVQLRNASMYHKFELDETLRARSNDVLARALQGGRQLTRKELASILEEAGIATDDLRLTLLVMHAELDGIICSGGRRGKQFTYALLDERAPQARVLTRDEALAELALRYFTSHGPATSADFTWWSGLTVADARVALELLGSRLTREVLEGEHYWFVPPADRSDEQEAGAYLLPNYDEYTVGYSDRTILINSAHINRLDTRDGSVLGHVLLLEGRVVGTWKRTPMKDETLININPLKPLSEMESEAFAREVERYGRFFGQITRWSLSGA